MGQRGPKPLPANVHLLKGNPSKKHFSVLNDGQRVPVEIPDMPNHLDAEARKEWKRISVELQKLGLIAAVDRAALAVYCVAYSRWARAEKKLKSLGDDGLIDVTPNDYKQISTWLQISNRAVEQMHKFLAEFGMTPSARNRVSVNPQQDLFGDKDGGSEGQPGGAGTSRFFPKS